MGVLGVGVGAPPTFPSRHVGVRACILVFNMLMCFCTWGALGVGVFLWVLLWVILWVAE